MTNSAVLFLTYKRFSTSILVFKAIRDAQPPRLYFVSNAPNLKNEGEIQQVEEVRNLLKLIDWPCEVITLFRDVYLPVKYSISSAIDWFFQHEEEGIILEDDVVPHEDFFIFCDHVLERYRSDERVMMATGTNYLSNSNLHDPYFFSQLYTIWGWATWRRAWLYYDVTMAQWNNIKVKRDIKYKFNNSFIGLFFSETFDSLNTSYTDTWDIQWFFACLYNSGLCVTPRVNLISNIGIEGVHGSSVTDSHFLKTEPLLLEAGFNRTLPVTVNSDYDSTLHELKTRTALRQFIVFKILRNLGLFDFVRLVYRKLRRRN